MKGKGKNNSNGEMRGSLHCAVHDETVNCFGRDDGYLWLGWGEQTTARARTVEAQASSQGSSQLLRSAYAGAGKFQ
jgi:hypothetical protein